MTYIKFEKFSHCGHCFCKTGFGLNGPNCEQVYKECCKCGLKRAKNTALQRRLPFDPSEYFTLCDISDPLDRVTVVC